MSTDITTPTTGLRFDISTAVVGVLALVQLLGPRRIPRPYIVGYYLVTLLVFHGWLTSFFRGIQSDNLVDYSVGIAIIPLFIIGLVRHIE